MQIRGLKTSDIFKMSKILKKMWIKIDPADKSKEQLGAELILAIGENLYLAEDEVYDFLGNLVGLTGAEFSELPITEVIEIGKQFKAQPGVSDFFKVAGQSKK